MEKWLRGRSRRGDEEKDHSAENLLRSSTLSGDEERHLAHWTTPQTPSRHTFWPWTVLNFLLLTFSLFVLSHSIYEKHFGSLNHHDLLKKTSYFSPVLEKFDIPTFGVQADGALFESSHPTRFRNARKPDPSVEAAWEEPDTIRTFPITAEEVRKLGKDPELAVKFPESYGLGSEAYVAQLDIFHQIHCLNLLRHLAWAEYGRDPSQPQKHPFSDLHWINVSHCTDMLMQTLMCQGSLDVLTFNWMETQEWPFPDFYVNHQCRDFEAIVEWQEEHALPLMMGRNITRPEGAKQIPAPEAYYEMFPEQNVSIHDKRWGLGCED